MSEIPWFWPGVVVSIAAALVLGSAVGRRIGAGPAGVLLVLSLGAIVAATLTPGREALEFGVVGSGGCDLRRLVPPSVDELRTVPETALNVVLFVPLGLVVGLLPMPRARLGLGLLALVLPFAIELAQMVALPLDRACESADVVDNLSGFALGLLAGLFMNAGRHALRRRT